MSNKPNYKSKSKVVLVTGAARRIGAEISKYFHGLDYNIIIHYRSSEQEAKSLSDSLNKIRQHSASVIQSDLGQLVEKDFLIGFITKVMSFYGSIDVLVNNASSFFPTPMGNVNLDEWRNLMISNTGGPFFLAQALAPYLEKTKGAIVNISDIHGKKPLKNYPVYSIAKAANNMLTKSLARELAPSIRVNAVAPGPIIWPEDENTLSEEQKAKISVKNLLDYPGKPLDIAKAVAFLAESEYITGQILAVDGGRSIRN